MTNIYGSRQSPPTRVVFYARYSSGLQRDASIDDQIRLCERRAEAEGWRVIDRYSDHARSGSDHLRPAFQRLLADARKGKFDIVLTESLDRLSRDLEHTSAFFKQLSFSGIRLVTLADGDVTDLHVGLKGTMAQLYLKDLSAKTWRGLEGRIHDGSSAGGLCYGYSVVREIDSRGNPIRGKRAIDEAQASTVRRIFEMFVARRSPRSIAIQLNAERVLGPHGKSWGPSTIYGNWRRGTGILNNELYIGRLIWNRQRFVKDPVSGKRVAQPNPEDQWIIQEVPDLRIVSQSLWEMVKKSQTATRTVVLTKSRPYGQPERARRPSHLFSGLLRCGGCGGGFSMIGATHYGCSNARNRATCSNRLTIRRDALENAVLNGLKDRLMQPDLVTEFIAEYHRAWNAQASTAEESWRILERELESTKQAIRRVIDAVKAGLFTLTMKEEMEHLEAKKIELEAKLTEPTPTPVRLHPNLSAIYSQKIERLREALIGEDTRGEAAEIFRSLIEEIRLIPADGTLRIHLIGKLTALLELGLKKQPGLNEETGLRTLVAGRGFEPLTFRL